MLMAHSIECRFPFLDPELMDLADSLPSSYKLRGLDEKHVLKLAAKGLVPDAIIARPKQPYRAPDAASFTGAGAPNWVTDMVSERAVADAGVFDPVAVRRLWRKVQALPSGGPYCNADNMALVGVLSTGLLHRQFIAAEPDAPAAVRFKTVVDRLSARSDGAPVERRGREALPV